ncbi:MULTISPECIES: energy transducer TonB [Rhodomicrobium]|uniref:energy transducer TonB family protein n=1 Tax=Rhodomicrobium TaxID=1068 RepID=UPI000B4B58D4|nr:MULTISPECIES: energy transducer TonB [Rhodomicrobium]
MDAIRIGAWVFSVAAHVTVAWLLVAELRGSSAIDAGAGTDQFLLEQGVGIENIVTFGDAAETVADADAALPVVQAASEQPEELKEDAPPAIATTAESEETTVVAKQVEPEPVEEVKAEQVMAAAEQVEQQAASSAQTGGLSTALSAYFGRVSRAFERHKAKPASRRAGVAIVRFSMEPSGRVISREIERSSGSAMLDNAALASVDRASPLPPVPPEIVAARPLTFSVPFNFIVR